MTKRRNVIVHIGTSADGYIARPDGDLEWLTSRPKPAGFYGMSAFMKSVDTKLLGRKTLRRWCGSTTLSCSEPRLMTPSHRLSMGLDRPALRRDVPNVYRWKRDFGSD